MENLVFFGSSAYVLPLIEVLRPKLVLTTEQKISQPVPSFCTQRNIPFTAITQWNNETVAQIKTIQAPAAILASFGMIIPQRILDLFPKGILNVHPSLLPKYRGSLPVQEALLHGEATTGVSIIKLDAEMDHGPLLAQETLSFSPEETADDAYKRFFQPWSNDVKTLFACLP